MTKAVNFRMMSLVCTGAMSFCLACARERAPSPVDTLASPAGAGSGEASLAASDDGRVHMTWLESDSAGGGGHALRFATLDRGHWSEPATIARGGDLFVNWADFPSVSVLDRDHFAVHWLQKHGSGAGSYAYGFRVSQSVDGGRTWSPPVEPYRDTTPTEKGFVTLWRDGSRGLAAVWLDGRKYHGRRNPANEMMLLATTFAPSLAPGSELRLDDRTCDCCQTAVAVTSHGPVIAYRNRSEDEIRDVYVTRRVNDTWTPGVPVHADNWKIAACPVNGPQLAARGEDVAIAWFTAPNDSARVNVAFSSDAGATFGAPLRVDEGAPAGRVDVALLADGAALVTWVERTGGDTALVLARRVHRDGRADASITVATSTAARASGFPRMAATADDVVLAWTEPGNPARVRMSRLALSRLR